MKRNNLIYGAIAGAITITWMLIFVFSGMKPNSEWGEIFGYGTMLVAYSMIVVGVKNYRDKVNGGVISFWKAFRIGLGITFIASTIYVATWLICYYASDTDFIQEYSRCMVDQLKASGASPAMIAQKTKEMQEFAVMYRNPFFNALITYLEIFPPGLIVSLIVALFMKRKQPKATV